MSRLIHLPRSLRGKLVAIVLGGVLAPAALITVWTTHRLQQAGRDLLYEHLDASVLAIARVAEDNWSAIRGNLMLLAGNDPIRAALRSPTRRFLPEEERYLVQAFALVRSEIDEVVFSDPRGRPQWRIRRDPALAIRVEPITSAPERLSSRFGAIAIDIPVVDEDSGTVAGTMTALLRLRALIPTGPLSAPATATLKFIDARDGTLLMRRDALVGSGSEVRSGSQPNPTELSVARNVRGLPLRVAASALLAPYVTPFQDSARRGAYILIAVLLSACGAAGFFAARTTRSLSGLAKAADAVARGDLEYRVVVRSGDEVERVATAFNAMTQDLRRTLRETSQRDALAAVGEFAAELAHEVRNPLTSVRLDLQRVEERLSDPKSRDLLSHALTVVDRLNRTVTGTLRVARSGNITLRPLQLEAALEPAIQATAPVLAARSITFDRNLNDAGTAWMLGDADALVQLFTNLLFNAAEAIEQFGRVGVLAQRQNGRVVVRIADSGPGIPPHILEFLDEPLHTTKRDGTGLGLSIARRIATLHRGSIEFDTAPGRGTVVVISFPRHDPAS